MVQKTDTDLTDTSAERDSWTRADCMILVGIGLIIGLWIAVLAEIAYSVWEMLSGL